MISKKNISQTQQEEDCVLYLPRLIKQEATFLKSAILETCATFDEAVDRDDKDYLRALHLHAKKTNPGFQPSQVKKLFNKHISMFRNGSEIDPEKIQPVLKLVDDNQFSELFAIVRSFWSMPYNKGYGRRLRFVVFDEYHQAVIGVIGLQSPPADLECRDSMFNYPDGEKLVKVNSTMDAYTVGAIPPYSFLLGGKLCAGLIATDTVRHAYWRQYAGKRTEMENANIQQPLVAVTTTSAFGRSSMYNRLRHDDRLLAEPIGYTRGYGVLHLESLYPRICNYLRMIGKFKSGGFGNGPKIRWQNITNALTSLEIPQNRLKHGIKREVFLFRLVDNLEEGMAGGQYGMPLELPEDKFSSYWKERWALPRSARFPHWSTSDSIEILRSKMAEL